MSKRPRALIDNGDGTHTVPLTRGMVAIIDSADAADVGRRNWCAVLGGARWYAARGENRRLVYLHRQITSAPRGMEVDHVDLDTLNCRRSNMRLATKAQNAHNVGKRSNNTSGLKGAVFNKRAGLWQSQICCRGVTTRLGYFRTAEDAHAAYCAAAERLHGEFARLA